MNETMTAVIAELKEAFEKFNEKHTFQLGDIVRWKQGMQNKRACGPFVVMELLESKVLVENEGAGSQYFREPLDIILGSTDEDGDLVCYHYDSRRFEPVE